MWYLKYVAFEIDFHVSTIVVSYCMKSTLIPNEGQIVSRAKIGDEGAYSILYDMYFARTFSYIHGKVFNIETARDLAQEVFITAFSKLGSFQERSSFSTWIHTIARNHIADFLKKTISRKESLYLLRDDQALSIGNSFMRPACSPDELLISSERIAEVDQLLDELPDKIREVLFCYIKGDTIAQIFSKTKVPFAQIPSYINLGKEYLRAHFSSQMVN